MSNTTEIMFWATFMVICMVPFGFFAGVAQQPWFDRISLTWLAVLIAFAAYINIEATLIEQDANNGLASLGANLLLGLNSAAAILSVPSYLLVRYFKQKST